MPNRLLTRRRHQDEPHAGAMLILVAVMLVILLAMTAFSVDVAYMQLVRTELRTATDAASHAASEALVRTQETGQARRAAKDAAALNLVAGHPLLLDDQDVIFGQSSPNDQGRFTFVPTNGPLVNSVRINGRRTGDSPSGEVPLFLGGLLNRREFEPVMSTTTTGLVRDIAIVLDRSGSMRSENKIGALISSVNVFLSILNPTAADERVSLATYSTTGRKDVAMTSDLHLIHSAVNGLVADGFTAIGQGLQIGSDSLEFDANSRPFAEKSIVLMTDGIENRAPFVNTVVPEAVARNHRIHTVTFGSGADQALMRDIANRTGGVHRHAEDGEDLREIFREIAKTLAVVLVE